MMIPLSRVSPEHGANMGFYTIIISLDYINRAGVLFLTPFETNGRRTFSSMLRRIEGALP